jgi:predicted nuclease of predicted toxin-antitoxin system
MRLLLDAQIGLVVAVQLRAAGVEVVGLSEWLAGVHRTAADAEILAAARDDQRILVTFDLKTVPSLLREWGDLERSHAGVILIDDKAIRSNDVGGLVRSLLALIEESRGEDWQDRVQFLRAR